MSLKKFLKDKWLVLFIFFILMIFTIFFLTSMSIPSYPILFIVGLYTLSLCILLLVEYFKKQRYYHEIQEQLNRLDQKYLLYDVITDANFQEGKLFYEMIGTITKSMNDRLDIYERERLAYEEYIEMWIHEIKTPIASAKLIAENHKEPLVMSMAEEIDKIEAFVEQVLFYAKSSAIEKDYIIKAHSLKSIVNKVIKKYASAFITLPIKLNLSDLDYTVYSDSKWIEFILSQIIGNAIKYLDKKEKIIEISALEQDKSILLSIKDNGVGIPACDLSRVFDKGFTGNNGRLYGKSTGIGLYLCKKLCIKLGLELKLSSTSGEGTTVTIIFPKSKMFLLEN